VADVRARIAWVLAGVTLVLVVADTVVTAQYRPLLSEAAVAVHGFPFVNGAVLGCALLGAVIIARYERHAIGWLLSLVGFTSAISLLAEAYGLWVLTEGGPGSTAFGGVSAWLASLLGGQLAIAGLALMFLLAPDGHFVSRRWRYAALATGLGVVCCVAALLTIDPRGFDIVEQSGSDGGLAGVLFSVGFLLISVGLLASVASMLQRLRRSRGPQREQVRLIAASAALIAAGVTAMLVVQLFNGGEQTWAAALPLFLSYLLLPVLFAVAVLRYRLYDIEVIINRTVVLAVGTAFAGIGYTTIVVAVGKLVDRQTSGFWLSLLVTALVALAFQPVRRRVVRIANRLAYGSRAQPYEALSDFSRRLAETPSPDSLLPAVAEAAGRAVSARRATATLAVPGGAVASAGWGGPGVEGVDVHAVPIRSGDAALGRIEVSIPKGRRLRPSDVRLLLALADQAAVAFRNSTLEAQLAGHVAELDRTTHELARSRSRIIEADDAARRALEAAISRDVLPHLVALPEELGRARSAVLTGSPANGIDLLVAGTNLALESLRELTRGVFPTQLARAGIEPALRSHLARSGLAPMLHVDASAARRFEARVEAAVFFCCAEAARGMSGLSAIDLSVVGDDLELRILGVVRDEVGLQPIIDRAEAVGGRLRTEPRLLVLTIPVGAAEPPSVPADGQGPDV